MLNLALCYDGGRGVPVDAAQAVVWYRHAAGLGNAAAMHGLGTHYGSTKDGALRDYAEAVRWHRQAADKGHTGSMLQLGLAYASGEGVGRDDIQAVTWYKKAATAVNALAMLELGQCYNDGRGVPSNKAEAIDWYGKAANLDIAAAMLKLGEYYQSSASNARNSAQTAVNWYKKAVDKGHADAMRRLGYCYHGGYGVQQSTAQALAWYRKAADAGSANGMLALSDCYANGNGVKRSAVRAASLCRAAAEAGMADAMVRMGDIFQHGRGVKVDYLQAAAWYRRTIRLPHADEAKVALARSNLVTLLNERSLLDENLTAVPVAVALPNELWENVALDLLKQAVQSRSDNAQDAMQALWNLSSTSHALRNVVAHVWRAFLDRHNVHRIHVHTAIDERWECDRARPRLAVIHLQFCRKCKSLPVICQACNVLTDAPTLCENYNDETHVRHDGNWLGCGNFLCDDCSSKRSRICKECEDVYVPGSELVNSADFWYGDRSTGIIDYRSEDFDWQGEADEIMMRHERRRHWPGWLPSPESSSPAELEEETATDVVVPPSDSGEEVAALAVDLAGI